MVPQGGTVVAALRRAMGLELGDSDQQLRSISAVFAGQVRHGPVEIDVQLLRRGRSMSQCSATLHNPGSEAGTTGVAVFGATAPRLRVHGYRAAGGTAAARVSLVPRSTAGRVRGRAHRSSSGSRSRAGLRSDTRPGPSTSRPRHCARCWYRFDEPVRLDDGRWDPLALVALCDTMPGAVGERLGPRPEMWLPPSADFTVHVLDDARAEWILAVNRARHAGDGYASVDMELWDMEAAVPKLVAYGTQIMFFSFPKE